VGAPGIAAKDVLEMDISPITNKEKINTRNLIEPCIRHILMLRLAIQISP
jgi:hypothetical protein